MNLSDNIRKNIDFGITLSFSDSEAQAIAERLKALAHPVRLQILQYLGNRENCCCNDFCACIPLAQSTISQHLKILNNAGIIDYKPAGNCSHYSLNPRALEEVMGALAQVSQLTGNSSPEKSSKTPRQELGEK